MVTHSPATIAGMILVSAVQSRPWPPFHTLIIQQLTVAPLSTNSIKRVHFEVTLKFLFAVDR